MLAAAVVCMTTLLYHEARGTDDLRTKLLVAEVVLNRADHRVENVCEVIYPPGSKQFHAPKQAPMREKAAKEQAKALSILILSGIMPMPGTPANYFHDTSVRPSWSRKFSRVEQSENLIFYEGDYGG
jgi:spore germination cell wall hydrolase CwlJ-like protein